MGSFNGVKVFSATKYQERAVLGEVITEWLVANPDIEIVDRVVTQSSDSEFHCLSITFFYITQKVANEQVSNRQSSSGEAVEPPARKMAGSRR